MFVATRTLAWLQNRRALVIAFVLLLSGIATVTYAASNQRNAPAPTRSAEGTIDGLTKSATAPRPKQHRPKPGTPSTVAPTATSVATPPLQSQPTTIAIPAIGVASEVIQVGLNPDNTLQAPQPGPDYDKAAWYKYSPIPGNVGPAIIEGHVDSAASGPSVFYKLGELRPGDQVEVTLANHAVSTFKVTGVREYPKENFPTAEVYGETTIPALRLITCGGTFDSSTGHYRSNVVVYATLLSHRAA